MTWGSRIVGGVALGVSAMLLAGCSTGQTFGLGTGPGPDRLQAAQFDEAPRLARSQVPEPGVIPADPGRAGLSLPPPESKFLPSGNPVLTTGAAAISPQRLADLMDGSKIRVKVRAWVNGRPIFDDEVMQSVGPFINQLATMPEPQRSEKFAELTKSVLERIIDQELMYQDAVKKLEKFNPKALAKFIEGVSQEWDKSVKKMRESGTTEDAIRQYGPTAHRIMQRDRIAVQYAQSRIYDKIKSQVTLDVVQEYYEAHKNEFMTVDKVFWQDVFIAVGTKHATLADARRFAEALAAQCRADGDFAKALPYDDGDSKFRSGDGFGHLHNEIRPPVLESYLFAMRDGDVGPVVELPTGFHVFRLVKREYAGTIPMTDQVQKQIRNKLEGQIGEHEYKQLTRELRSRAVWHIVRDAQ